MSSPNQALQDALAGPLADLGVDLEDVVVSKAGRRHVVRVVIDRDGGVDLDTVAAASQRVSEVLDEPAQATVVPGPFVLEVTSPGVDRPLTEARHWRRARTRLVKATLRDGTLVEGRVADVPADDRVLVETESGEVALDPADVQNAVVQVEFNRADAAPDDDSGEE